MLSQQTLIDGFQGRRTENILYLLQQNLLKVWTQLKVENYYQNIILEYLDTLSLNDAQQYIAKEIKDVHEGKSSYFKLSEKLHSRRQSLSVLETLVNTKNLTNIDSECLSSICQQVNSLRDDNLCFAETLIHIYRQLFASKGYKISDQCMQMLKQLDQDNQFLKDSFLKDFILFHPGYDPFFMYHYDTRGKKQPNKVSYIIDQLFTLTLSYSCRLFKVKNQILQLISYGNNKKTPMKKKESSKNLPQMSHQIVGNKDQNEQGGNKCSNKRSVSLNFKRIKNSLKPSQQKKQLKEFKTINFHTLNSQRRSSSLMKDKRFSEQPEKVPKPSLLLQRFKQKKQREQSLTPDEEQQKRNFKYQTEKDEQDENVSLPNKYTIKHLKPVQPLNEEANKGTIVTQQDDEPSPQRKISFRLKKNLHPLNKGKKNHHIYLPQEGTERKYSDIQPLRQQQSQKCDSSYSSPLSLSSKMTLPLSPKIHKKRATQEPKKLQESNFLTSTSKQGASRKVSPGKQKIKMRLGKYQYSQLIKHLKCLKFGQQIKKRILSERWDEWLKKYQSYVSQYIIEDEVIVIAISLLLPDGDYLIKLWGATQACSSDISISLFQKYVEYLQMTTHSLHIHYQGDEIQQLSKSGFICKKQKIFIKQRSCQLSPKSTQFSPFLSLKCSNIIVPQQNISNDLLISQQIEAFSPNNFFSYLPFTSINRRTINQNLQMLVKISENITDMKTLNTLLQDEDLDTYETTKNMKITNIKALRLHLHTPFTAPFLASEGFFTFHGTQIFKSDKATICLITCQKFNTKVFFGKGFTSAGNFITNLKSKKGEQCQFRVKMFSKQLYGKMVGGNEKEGCYGYWQINLSWQDQLLGRTKHQSTTTTNFGPQSFYVGIEIQSELVYCFQVHQEDFLL